MAQNLRFSIFYQFFDLIALLIAYACDNEGRYALGDRSNGAGCITLLFREEAVPVGDDETQIARTRLINPRIVDLVEDAVTQREPDPTLRLQCGTNAAFGA